MKAEEKKVMLKKIKQVDKANTINMEENPKIENDILAKLKDHLEWEGDISFNLNPYVED